MPIAIAWEMRELEPEASQKTIKIKTQRSYHESKKGPAINF